MRELLERRERGDDAAALAIDMFCARVAMEMGAYATVLGGLDTIVFTAGIGERAALVRDEVCTRLAHLGLAIDDARNGEHFDVISSDASSVVVRVVPTDEDSMIARHTAALVS
jgi:acetate kinase